MVTISKPCATSPYLSARILGKNAA
jgi:hypothetical protein